MECYSEQICTTFVDGELAVDEARRLRNHLATCPRCRKLVDALRAENRALTESLRQLPEEAENFVRRFSRSTAAHRLGGSPAQGRRGNGMRKTESPGLS